MILVGMMICSRVACRACAVRCLDWVAVRRVNDDWWVLWLVVMLELWAGVGLPVALRFQATFILENGEPSTDPVSSHESLRRRRAAISRTQSIKTYPFWDEGCPALVTDRPEKHKHRGQNDKVWA